jgi:hypothetical protein
VEVAGEDNGEGGELMVTGEGEGIGIFLDGMEGRLDAGDAEIEVEGRQG